MLRETATRNSTSAQDGLSESSPRTRMTADCEGTRNSANRRQTVEKEMQQMGKTWSSISVMTKDWQKWRDHVVALQATRRNGRE